MERSTVQHKLCEALKNLAKKDHFLLAHDVNERSITHKLASYLEAEFQDWDVDCEYNRDGLEDTKRLDLDNTLPETNATDTNAASVYPDIIVHKRGTSTNLLVVEVKKESNTKGQDWDRRKLCAYKSQLGYEHAVSVTLGNRKPRMDRM